MERKRRIVVDTSGLLLAVVMHSADVQDLDGGYRGAFLSGRVRERLGCRLEIVPRRSGRGGFAVLPRR